MPDLESIISSAVADAEAGGLDGGDDGGTDTGDTADVVAPASSDGDKPVATGDAGTADTKVPAATDTPVEPVVDPVAKELEDLGLAAPKAGERENRLPYSRVKKIVENSRTKLTAAHTTALAEVTTKLTAAEQKVQQMDRADQLFATDPDRALMMLESLHPGKYKKFLTPPTAAAAAVTPLASTVGPRPGPDVEYQDGSRGYSPDQHAKLLDWISADAELKAYTRAKSDLDARLGPVEAQNKKVADREAALAANAALVPVVQAKIKWGRETWGKMFEDDYKLDGNSAVVKYINEHKVGFEAACAAVFLPKVQAERTRMRAEIITEMNARPKAAARTVPAAITTAASAEAKSTEDVIRDAIAGLK
jgi:hypothetical protein